MLGSLCTYLYLIGMIAAITASAIGTCFNGGDTRTESVISVMGVVILILLPLLTFQRFDDSRSAVQTFISLGAKRSHIFWGKLIGAITVALIPCLILLALPPCLAFMGSVSYVSAYLSICAFILTTTALTSLLCALYALFDNPKGALMGSYILNVLLYVFYRVCIALGSGSLICSLISVIAPSYTLYQLSAEFFEIGILIKPALLAFLGIAIAYAVFKLDLGNRYTVNVPPVKRSALAVPGCALALCLAAALILGSFPISADLSTNGITKLGQATVSEIEKINSDTTVYLITPTNSPNLRMQKILDRMASYNDHITVEQLDPEEDRLQILEYTSSTYEASFGAIIVKGAKRTLYIPYSDFYYYSEEAYLRTLYAYIALESTVSLSQFMLENTEYPDLFMHDGYRYEEALAQALVYCNSDSVNEICLVGNLGLSEDLRRYAIQSMTEFKYVSLENADIPSDCDAVLLYNFGDITQKQLQKLSAYLDNGGKLLTLLECFDTSSSATAQADDYTNLNELVEEFGISCDTSVILDDANSEYLPSTVVHDTSLTQGELYMPYLNPITVSEELPVGVSVDVLISTTANSYAKKELTAGELDFDPETDTRQSYPIAVNSTAQNGASVTMVTSGMTVRSLYDYQYDFEAFENAISVTFKMLGALSGSYELAPSIAPISAVCPVTEGNQTLTTVWTCSGVMLAVILLIIYYKKYSEA